LALACQRVDLVNKALVRSEQAIHSRQHLLRMHYPILQSISLFFNSSPEFFRRQLSTQSFLRKALDLFAYYGVNFTHRLAEDAYFIQQPLQHIFFDRPADDEVNYDYALCLLSDSVEPAYSLFDHHGVPR
jgi:hypothetical protein